jgi:ornithine cyclodeaminase
MRVVGAQDVHRSLDYPALIDALAAQFRAGAETPLRHHHGIKVPDGADATLLLMPAWQEGGALGVKLVTVFPDNGRRGLPAVQGVYLLLDGQTGVPRALIDGPALTARRTAAASALAARHLARPDARRLLMVGTGTLAPHLVRAHAAARPIAEVALWGRAREKAERLARDLAAALPGIAVRAVRSLEEAVPAADIVSCATLATEPLIRGAWLRPGQHLDLVGGFRPDMREADDDAVRRARVFVDTRAGALKEAGDIVQPLEAGVIAERDIAGDLFDLARGAPGRRNAEEITLFKSVGTALEDLAAARLVAERLGL